MLGLLVVRGERLNKLSDSWFSTISIEVECYYYFFGVKYYKKRGATLLIFIKHGIRKNK